MKRGFTNRRCSKCNGNVFVDQDSHGWYEWCLQCGYTRPLKPASALVEELKLIPVKKELAIF